MRLTTWRMVSVAALGMLVGGTGWGQDEPAKAETPEAKPAERLRTVIEKLDANGDRVIERGEVPEDGLAAFDRLLGQGDANKDGKLELEEVRGLMQAMRPGGNGPGLAQLKAMDADKDGQVTREEWTGAEAMFDRLDGDKDGKVSEDEAKQMAGRLRAQMQQRLKRMDADGDGKVTKAEFRGNEALFSRLDRNTDGTIDEAELKAGQQGPRDKAGAGRPKAKGKGKAKAAGPEGGEVKPVAGRPRAGRPGKAAGARGAAGPRPGMAAMDTDGDGKVSKTEFRGRESRFTQLDRNGDGVIEKGERPGGGVRRKK